MINVSPPASVDVFFPWVNLVDCFVSVWVTNEVFWVVKALIVCTVDSICVFVTEDVVGKIVVISMVEVPKEIWLF